MSFFNRKVEMAPLPSHQQLALVNGLVLVVEVVVVNTTHTSTANG